MPVIDLKGPFQIGEHLLTLTDYRLQYPVIAKLKKILNNKY